MPYIDYKNGCTCGNAFMPPCPFHSVSVAPTFYNDPFVQDDIARLHKIIDKLEKKIDRIEDGFDGLFKSIEKINKNIGRFWDYLTSK